MAARVEWVFAGVPVQEAGGTRVVTLTLFSKAQASETGRYLSDLGKVLSGWLTARDFEAAWRDRTIGGVQVEWRADFAVEAVRRAGPPPGAERCRRTVRRRPS